MTQNDKALTLRTVYLEDSLNESIRKFASLNEMSQGEFIRYLIRLGLSEVRENPYLPKVWKEAYERRMNEPD